MKKLLVLILFFIIFIPNANASTNSANEYILMDMSSGRILL